MTLDILNSSRIGKIVNDIRHFSNAQSDIKSRLKDLIKQWNDQLLPHLNNKKQNKTHKPSDSNGCNKPIKVSESSNNMSHYNNENYKEKHLLSVTKPRSSNNLEILNGKNKPPKDDCDNSFEIPHKKQRLDNKILYSESPKTLLKEIHLDVESCPPIYSKSNSNSDLFPHKHDSPAAMHFTDVKRFIKKEEELLHHQLHNNVSPSTHKDKHRKRKPDHSFNGVPATHLQKVKSTRELLAEMGDLVGSDTKKKILCNEIAFEEDIPKSCIPESVRPKPKLIKHAKTTAQNSDTLYRTVKSSPKLSQQPIIADDDFLDYPISTRSTVVDSAANEQPMKSERSFSSSSLSQRSSANQKYHHHSPYSNNNSHSNSNNNSSHQHNGSPYHKDLVTHHKDYHRDQQLKRSSSPASDDTNHAQSVATPTLSDDLMKLKFPIKPAHKKKSKQHDPPVTNRMNDLPTLPSLVDPLDGGDRLAIAAGDRPRVRCDEAGNATAVEDEAELVAHFLWEGHNCTRHPVSGELFGFNDLYKVDHLCVLAWTDRLYDCASFFPGDTGAELAWLEATICEIC